MDAPTSFFGAYRRTIIVVASLVGILLFSFIPIWPAEECTSAGGGECLVTLRRAIWVDLYEFFLWLETTPFGVIGKTWGAAFAFVEAIHLLGMAL